MPSITKAEYDRLKITEAKYQLLTDDYGELLERFRIALNSAKTWRRYYDAVRETFKIDEEIDIPGCFNPMDTVEFIVKKQKEIDDILVNYKKKVDNELDNYTREMP